MAAMIKPINPSPQKITPCIAAPAFRGSSPCIDKSQLEDGIGKAPQRDYGGSSRCEALLAPSNDTQGECPLPLADLPRGSLSSWISQRVPHGIGLER